MVKEEMLKGRGKEKKSQDETARDGKNIDSVRASETDCKENDPALRKTEVVSSIGL